MRTRNFNALNDALFKYIFGRPERQNITCAFINAVLGLEGSQAISELKFADRTMDADAPDDKITVLDILCIANDETRFNIEVQVQNLHDMERRTLYYWSQLYRDSIKRSADYSALHRTVTINLLAYSFLPQNAFHNMYGLYDIRSKHRLPEDIEIHFLELPKVTRKDLREMRRLEKWMAFFENDLTDEEMEELSMSEPAIGDAWSAADEFLRDTANFHTYMKKEKAMRDYLHETRRSFEDGERAGVKKGRAEGMAAERNRFILKLLENGTSIEEIAAMAELPAEEIRALATSHGMNAQK